MNNNATPQPLLELIVSGTMILETGARFVETAKALTAQCNAGMRPKQFCADFKTCAVGDIGNKTVRGHG